MVVLGRSGWIGDDVRELADKVRPYMAALVGREDVRVPVMAAHEAITRAGHLFVRQGPQYGVIEQNVEAPSDPAQLAELRNEIEKAFQSVNRSLEALDEIISESRSGMWLTLSVPFGLAVLLFGAAIAAFAWGVVHGSKVALFGSGGGVVFAATLAFGQMHAYNRQQLLLRTMVARLRTQVAGCRGGEPKATFDCLRRALGKVDQYFDELGAVAAKSRRSS